MKTIAILLYFLVFFPSTYAHADLARGAAALLVDGKKLVAKLAKKKADAAKKAADDAIPFGPRNSVGKMFDSIREIMGEGDMPIRSPFDEVLRSFSKNEDEEALMEAFFNINGQKLKKFKESYDFSELLVKQKTVLDPLKSIFNPRFPSSVRLNALAYVYSELSPVLARMELSHHFPPKDDSFFDKTMIWALNNCVGDALKSQKKEDVLRKIQEIVSAQAKLYHSNSRRRSNRLYIPGSDENVFLATAHLLESNIENKEAFNLIIESFAQEGFKLMAISRSRYHSILSNKFRSVKRKYKEFHGVSMQSDPDFVLSSDNILYAIFPFMRSYYDSVFSFRSYLFKAMGMGDSSSTEDVHFLIKAMLFELKNKSNIDSVHTTLEEVRAILIQAIENRKFFRNENLVKIMHENEEFAQWVNDIRARL